MGYVVSWVPNDGAIIHVVYKYKVGNDHHMYIHKILYFVL